MELTGEDHDGTIESNGKIGPLNGKDIHILNSTLTRSKVRKASDTAQWYALAFRVEFQHGKHHQLPYCLSGYKNMSSKLDGIFH
ncbi:hypothetical protein I3271_00880 [Photobacterium leiognathi]|uniref:hypothetical protein n=1 Tax=Photobacterium leiognathi TaxID=553611 RepID=UPI001EDF6367|nr:hypothetical protein [Photobacterium leiognathi]MCG3883236.1 hypothetical protein [Photobacterium leiognathi]